MVVLEHFRQVWWGAFWRETFFCRQRWVFFSVAFWRETFFWRQRWVFFAVAFWRETLFCRQRWGFFAAELFLYDDHEVEQDLSVLVVVVVLHCSGGSLFAELFVEGSCRRAG